MTTRDRQVRLRGRSLKHCRTVVPLVCLVEFLEALARRRLTEQAGNWVEPGRRVHERSPAVPAPPPRPTPRLNPEHSLAPRRSRNRALVPSRSSERLLHPRPRAATRLPSGHQTRHLLGALGRTRAVHHGPTRQPHRHLIRQVRWPILDRDLRRRRPHHLTQQSRHHQIPLPHRFQERQPHRHLDRRVPHSTRRVHRRPYQQGRPTCRRARLEAARSAIQRGRLRPVRQTPRAPGWGRATTQQAPDRPTQQTPQPSRHPTHQVPHQRAPRTRRSR